MGHRAWWAYQCLPKDRMGHAPKFRELERAAGLTNNQLRRLIWDEYKRPGLEQLEKFAKALNTTAEWLQFERGEGPKADGYIRERPEAPLGMRKKSARVVLELDADTQGAFARKSEKLLESGRASRRRNAGK
jgi:transcriptional regulator with XRE-family HTH domain